MSRSKERVLVALAVVLTLAGRCAANAEAATNAQPSLAPPRRPAADPLLTLAAAERLALANHPLLKAVAFDRAAASEAVKIARSGFSPQVSAEAVQAVAPGGTRIAAYSAISDPTIVQRTAAGVGISQYITDFGRTGDLVRASQLELRAQAAQNDATRDQVLLDVTQAYFEALRAEALLNVADETAHERDTLLREIETLQRSGLRSTLDVSIAERDSSEANQLVVEARNQRIDAFAGLAEAIGSADYRIYRLEDVPSTPKLPPTLETFISEAIATSPLLAASQAQQAADLARAAAASRLTSPTVTGYGFFGVSPWKESNTALASPYAAAGVALTIPVYTGGELSAERRQAYDVVGAAAQRTNEERNQLLREVRSAYENVRSAQETIVVNDQLLREARRALSLTQTRYRLGLSSISDLSVAQLQEQQAAIARTNATYDFVAQQASLQYAAGIIAGGLVPMPVPGAMTPESEAPMTVPPTSTEPPSHTGTDGARG